MYKQIAKVLNTKAYRAVGTALAKNKTPIAIPCHRVINSDGAVGNYSGPKGITQKIKLLREEGIEIIEGKIEIKKYFPDSKTLSMNTN